MKKILVAFLVIFATLGAKAQTNTLYFMEDVPRNMAWNPAFMPKTAWYIGIGLSDIFLEGGNSSLMLSDFIYKKNGSWTTAFNSQQSIEQLYKRIGNNMYTDMRFSLNLLNFGFRFKERNYFTFDMSVKGDIALYTPRDLTRLLLLGTGTEGNFDFRKSGIEAILYGEVALGYTRRINDKWTAGAKLKGLLGFAGVHTSIDEMSFYASRTRWDVATKSTMYVMAPGITRNSNGSLNFDSFSWQQLVQPSGTGVAIDLGATFKPIESLTLSAAVTDLGFISWGRDNTAYINADGKFSFEGIEFKPSSNADTLRNYVDRMWDRMQDSIKYTTAVGTTGGVGQWLTTSVNVGAEYGILENKISFAALGNFRINNHLIMPELTLGVNLRPANWFKVYLSHTVAGRLSGTMGAGFNVKVGPLNMYLISDFLPVSFARVQNLEGVPNNLTIPYSYNRFNIQTGLVYHFGRKNDNDRDGVANDRDKCPDTEIDRLMQRCPDKKRKSFVDRNGCILDDDGDGVANCYDLCPNTPQGVSVDDNGCPFDSDGDKVYDYLDRCPNTPEGVAVDADGCPFDTDGDKVYDYLDKCPNTPEGVQVDAVGCPLDTDGDGVPDYLDKCPGTPKGIDIDKDGCPLDSDGDGVNDDKDKCPNTPKGATVDAFGCPQDTDGDGIADFIDKCPNTPKAAIATVDEYGCPKDTDGDGVLDYLDRCPNIKGVASNNGCPEVNKEVLKVFKQALHGVQFDSGKATLKPVSYGILDMIVTIMNNNPTYNLDIAGHTDSQGDDAMNMDLSNRRAATVRQYLIDKGIAESRLQSKGYGETMPVADNKTAAGRAKNRRVEFTVVFEKLVKEGE